MRKTGPAMLLWLLALLRPGFAQDVDVDLELVLAVDVSRSMDAAEQALQKQGYVAALRHPEVISAIRSGFLGRIAVTYVEWAGPRSQEIIVPWALIDGDSTAEDFVNGLSTRSVSFLHGTSISGALAFSAGLFEGNGFSGARQVIDVSGDGPNNMGFPVLTAREAVLAKGITINGLPIMIENDFFGGYNIRDLDIYYEDCVIGGPGAFLLTVENIDRITEAIRRKLVLEIAGAEPRIVPAQFSESRPRVDCLIGEKIRRRWMDN